MSAREVDRSDDSAATSSRRKAPPSRMRNHRIVAEPRTDPDLHKLAQLFISMAFARANAEREARRNSSTHRQQTPPGSLGR